MKCKICDTEIIIPDDKILSNNKNIAIVESNGDLYCIGCKEAKDFAFDIDDNCKEISNADIKEQKIKVNIKKVYYNCIKCSKTFTGSTCTCGFTNPLYRR